MHILSVFGFFIYNKAIHYRIFEFTGVNFGNAMYSISDPKDVADGVVFLLSDMAKMINGTILQIDGGLTSN